MSKDLNTPIWQLTAGELIDCIVDYMTPEHSEVQLPVQQETEHVDRYVHGIESIAKLLGVSKTMVHEYRKKGWIEPAIRQIGRKIICDAQLALELFGRKKNDSKADVEEYDLGI
jgi:hypothetical protein